MAPPAGTGRTEHFRDITSGSYQVTIAPAGWLVASCRTATAGGSDSRHAQAVSYHQSQAGAGGRTQPASPGTVTRHKTTAPRPGNHHPHLILRKCYHPDGRRVQLLTDHTTGAYNTNKLITALQRLPTLLDHAPVILIWDGLPAHRSTAMKAWLTDQTHWLRVVPLPGYAPELNPAEPLWSAIKGKDLANYAATDLTDLWHTAHRGLQRIRRNPTLLWSFLAHTGLTITRT